MSASPVRELARRHAAGELSLEDYRARRHELIDDIIGGKTPLTYGERRPAGRSPNKSLKGLSPVVIGGAGFILALIIGSALWLMLPVHHAIHAAHHAATPPQAPAQSISPGPVLIEKFLRTNDWSTENVQKFTAQWKKLPKKEQEIARQDYHFPRLTSELRQQIVSQQAMAGLTTSSSDIKAQLASLQKMANILGIKTNG